MNVFVFDIETIPDIDGARRLYNLHGLSDEDVAKAIFHKRRQQANTECLQHHLQKIVAISAILITSERFNLWSLGEEDATEQDLLERFFGGLDRYTPRLVSWGGTELDLPVIHYRSLIYPVNAGRYWERGQQDSEFQSNNYISRHHERHTDMREVLSAYNPAAAAELNDIASLCGFPGNLGMSSNKVWENWLTGDIKSIRNDCETNVLNTYLIYLNWERNRGRIDNQQYQQQCDKVRAELIKSAQPHLIEFEKHWIEL